MTENRCIEVLKKMKHMFTETCAKIDENTALDMAVEAIQEIQSYRAIGTVEELKEAKAIYNEIILAEARLDLPKECIAYEVGKLREKELMEYNAIGTIEEFKSLKEKDTPYKPKEYEDRYYACKCGNALLHKWDEYPTKLMPKSRGYKYCLNCGRVIDWSE